MRRQKQYKPIELNLTAMMDVTLQLIIFFLLVNNISSSELPDLETPEPQKSRAFLDPDRHAVTVNMIPRVPGANEPKAVRVGQRDIPPDSYGELTRLIETELAKNPDVQVDLRVDRHIHYLHVQPVINAISAAGVGRINVITQVDKERYAPSRKQ